MELNLKSVNRSGPAFSGNVFDKQKEMVQAAVKRQQDSGLISRAEGENYTLSGLTNPYPGPLFDICGDGDLMSLSFAGRSPFLDWISWTPTNVETEVRAFLSWVRPEDTNGSASVGYLSNPCADPNSFDVGTCDFTVNGYALLRRMSPTRDLTKNSTLNCITQPRLRIDGSRVDTNREWDMVMATEVMLQDLSKMVVSGNKATPGMFSGLEVLVNTGYKNSEGHRCSIMDSLVIDWNGNGVDGGSGITWNGQAIGSSIGLFQVIMQAYRNIKRRIQMAPTLASRPMAPGDMIILMPLSFIDCVLKAATCYKICGNDWTRMDSFQARQYYENLLNGGKFGAGRIFIDGFEIPFMPYDWELINSTTKFDMYILLNQLGGVRLIQGEYRDLTAVPSLAPEFAVTDRGMMMHWYKRDNTCEKLILEQQPRLIINAPWAQVRITDVACSVPGGPISADPWSTSFFPETSFFPVG